MTPPGPQPRPAAPVPRRLDQTVGLVQGYAPPGRVVGHLGHHEDGDGGVAGGGHTGPVSRRGRAPPPRRAAPVALAGTPARRTGWPASTSAVPA